MKSKKSTNKNGAITKKITLNSERKDMTITDTLALCSINRCSSSRVSKMLMRQRMTKAKQHKYRHISRCLGD
ncbi:MAG: hypothetical protein JRI56_10510 [Deltaproteobacteria bacterium]|nr:hypothetical protein [Deltaproteobacteria bacterium]